MKSMAMESLWQWSPNIHLSTKTHKPVLLPEHVFYVMTFYSFDGVKSDRLFSIMTSNVEKLI